MSDVLFRLVLGHIMGDYMLQTRWMAYGKKARTMEGALCAGAHTLAYTASVCAWLLPECVEAPWLVTAIWLTHWPIDRFPVAEWIIHTLGRKGPCEAAIPGEAAVSAFVYIVIDNGIHLMLMYAALKLAGVA